MNNALDRKKEIINLVFLKRHHKSKDNMKQSFAIFQKYNLIIYNNYIFQWIQFETEAIEYFTVLFKSLPAIYINELFQTNLVTYKQLIWFIKLLWPYRS